MKNQILHSFLLICLSKDEKKTFPDVSGSAGRSYFYAQWKACQPEQNFKDAFNTMNQNLKITFFPDAPLDSALSSQWV